MLKPRGARRRVLFGEVMKIRKEKVKQQRKLFFLLYLCGGRVCEWKGKRVLIFNFPLKSASPRPSPRPQRLQWGVSWVGAAYPPSPPLWAPGSRVTQRPPAASPSRPEHRGHLAPRVEYASRSVYTHTHLHLYTHTHIHTHTHTHTHTHYM